MIFIFGTIPQLCIFCMLYILPFPLLMLSMFSLGTIRMNLSINIEGFIVRREPGDEDPHGVQGGPRGQRDRVRLQ